MQVLDPDSRELLRTRPNPLTTAQAIRVHGARPAGPLPQPNRAPIRVQRRVASNGVIMVAGQTIALGRTHGGQVVTVQATDTLRHAPQNPHNLQNLGRRPVLWVL
jgi:hypothetical protein